MRLFDLLLSKLFPDPLSQPLSPRHKHALIHRVEMERHPIEDPMNWLPRKKSLDRKILRPHLWRRDVASSKGSK